MYIVLLFTSVGGGAFDVPQGHLLKNTQRAVDSASPYNNFANCDAIIYKAARNILLDFRLPVNYNVVILHLRFGGGRFDQ